MESDPAGGEEREALRIGVNSAPPEQLGFLGQQRCSRIDFGDIGGSLARVVIELSQLSQMYLFIQLSCFHREY
jgi:hypothetical protein